MKKKQQKQKQISEKEYLAALLEQFVKLQAGSKSRIEKYEGFSARKGSKDWDFSKKKKVETRLEQARLEYSQSFEIIDSIKRKLEQL